MNVHVPTILTNFSLHVKYHLYVNSHPLILSFIVYILKMTVIIQATVR